MSEILVHDLDSPRLQAAEYELGARTFRSIEAALDARPTLVLVCTPPTEHIAAALAAAERGCHLFIEKPLSDRWDDVKALQDIVRRHGLVTLVGCNLRFHPGLQTTKRLLDEGAVGQVTSVRAEVGQYLPDWHPWEDYRSGYSARRDLGGGVILDAIHELDYVQWFFGPVDAVACFAGRLSRLDIDTEDTAAILLRFASGPIGEVHLDYVQRSHSRGCEIIGDEGTIRWDYPTGLTRWYSARSREWQGVGLPPGWEPNAMYVEEMQHLLRTVQGDEPSMADLFEAARVLQTALAAKVSARTVQVIAPSSVA